MDENRNTVVPNSIGACIVSGKQKKDPTKEWEGLAVTAVVDQVTYSGLIFAKREKNGTPVLFNNC